DMVSNQTFTAGDMTTGVNFIGTAGNYSWVNDTPSIGLPANGSGNIAPFLAVNNGTTPVTATVTVTPSNPGSAYIPNYNDNTVSVINTADNTVEAKIDVGVNPIAVTVSPDGSKVFVANRGDNTISEIDATTNTKVSVIPYGTSPNSLT